MSTLTSPRVHDQLSRLFVEAEHSMERFRRERRDLLAHGFAPGTPEFANASRKAHLAVAPETGQLLYLLTRARRPRLVVEFGTSFGVSTLHLAAALRDCGDGRLLTTEIEPTKAVATASMLADAGLDDLVDIRQGDARETLVDCGTVPVDLVFLDGANHLYVEVLQLVEPQLSAAAVVIADNAEAPGYRDYIRRSGQYVTVEVSSRVEVSVLADRAG